MFFIASKILGFILNELMVLKLRVAFIAIMTQIYHFFKYHTILYTKKIKFL